VAGTRASNVLAATNRDSVKDLFIGFLSHEKE
jgi:hypothetical protein